MAAVMVVMTMMVSPSDTIGSYHASSSGSLDGV
jgi:hypothetical protein